MPEIRINRKQDPEKEYGHCSQSVQEYHRYDVYLDDLCNNRKANERRFFESFRKQLIILAGMNEDEYQELQKTLEGHIVQKRIEAAEQRRKVMEFASGSPDGRIYTYCVDRVEDDLCVPLAVFEYSELDQARSFAREAAGEQNMTIQLCEGMFDCEGNVLCNDRITAVIDTWNDNDSEEREG